ncbi:DUF6265 family protein [Stakelama tenebrarum]|uniref:DUF6265 domain-containing protein n=1 Tax=Stakelama tenebrarum TaxID=2711215 RepID=A0A6G6Y1I1_9SPHN|nr:DUF6265 family protein [Sphingosinithalassobacter tenebrarum]QIG78667.1 hypothetical protein G5C33_01930 [Sphingosinithalassobacter tenebrarum]
MLRTMLLPIAALALAANQSAAPTIADVAFMAGEWGATDADGWTIEHWSQPAGGTMMGYAMSGDDSVTFREFLRIAPDAEGTLALVVTGVDLTPVAFTLTETAPNRVTFEAPEHDYPQKISYMRDGDVMVATISMADGSNPSTWEYRRR